MQTDLDRINQALTEFDESLSEVQNLTERMQILSEIAEGVMQKTKGFSEIKGLYEKHAQPDVYDQMKTYQEFKIADMRHQLVLTKKDAEEAFRNALKRHNLLYGLCVRVNRKLGNPVSIDRGMKLSKKTLGSCPETAAGVARRLREYIRISSGIIEEGFQN